VYRLAVAGVLLLTDDDFRIFQADGDELDEQMSLWIDDALAVAEIRSALPPPAPGAWWYFGKAMVEAWTRTDRGRWVLHDVVSVWLDEAAGDQSLRVKVRAPPWGWDEML
jgi:hypothetical protein